MTKSVIFRFLCQLLLFIDVQFVGLGTPDRKVGVSNLGQRGSSNTLSRFILQKSRIKWKPRTSHVLAFESLMSNELESNFPHAKATKLSKFHVMA